MVAEGRREDDVHHFPGLSSRGLRFVIATNAAVRSVGSMSLSLSYVAIDMGMGSTVSWCSTPVGGVVEGEGGVVCEHGEFGSQRGGYFYW